MLIWSLFAGIQKRLLSISSRKRTYPRLSQLLNFTKWIVLEPFLFVPAMEQTWLNAARYLLTVAGPMKTVSFFQSSYSSARLSFVIIFLISEIKERLRSAKTQKPSSLFHHFNKWSMSFKRFACHALTFYVSSIMSLTVCFFASEL